EHVELDLDRIGVVDGEEVLSDQVTCDDGDHADDETQLGGRLGDRLGLLAERQELLLLGGQAGGRLLHGRLERRPPPQVPAGGAGAPAGHDEGPDEVVAGTLAHETSISCFSSATRSGVSTVPARSTSSVVW